MTSKQLENRAQLEDYANLTINQKLELNGLAMEFKHIYNCNEFLNSQFNQVIE